MGSFKKIVNRVLASFRLGKVNKQAWEKRVLLIREDAIGDFLLSTGGIKYCKEFFSDKDVYLLVDYRLADLGKLYVAEDHLILLNKNAYYDDLDYRIMFLNKLRSIGFKTVISSIHRSSHCNDITKLTGAEITWGYERELIFPVRRFGNYNHQITSLDRVKTNTEHFNHVIEHEAYMVSRLTGKEVSAKDVYPLIPLTDIRLRQDYFVYLPEAGDSSRVYQPERFFPFLEKIAKEKGLKCLVIGVNPSVKVPESVYIENLLGKTTLAESLKLVAEAALVVGNETGLAHAAWIMNQKLIMIYGGGHYGRFLPLSDTAKLVIHKMDCYQCDWTCKYNERPFPCIGLIAENEIENAILSFLN